MEILEITPDSEIKGFLDSRIEKEVAGKIAIWGHKGMLNVEGADLFHDLLMKAGIHELRDDGDLLAEFKLHKESCRWYTAVLRTGREEFLEKYAGDYSIHDS